MPCAKCKEPINIMVEVGNYTYDYRSHTLNHIKCYKGLMDEKETKE